MTYRLPNEVANLEFRQELEGGQEGEGRNMDTDWGQDGGLITATHSTNTTHPTQHHVRHKIQNEQKPWLGPNLFVCVFF